MSHLLPGGFQGKVFMNEPARVVGRPTARETGPAVARSLTKSNEWQVRQVFLAREKSGAAL